MRKLTENEAKRLQEDINVNIVLFQILQKKK